MKTMVLLTKTLEFVKRTWNEGVDGVQSEKKKDLKKILQWNMVFSDRKFYQVGSTS